MNSNNSGEQAHGERRHGLAQPFLSPRRLAALGVLCALIVLLPLMMGNRTPATLTTTGLVLALGALLVGWLGFDRPANNRRGPPPAWCWCFGLVTASVIVQLLPVSWLATAFGPYPEALLQHPEFRPRQWSPSPGATARAWAAFVALFLIAWFASTLTARARAWMWLTISAMALFQAVYGLVSHAAESTTIFGIWERAVPERVHGSFSNQNLFAGYLALTWPLAVMVWWLRNVPLISGLPKEMRVTGSVLSAALLGAAIMGSASRLGSAAAVIGMLCALILWSQRRDRLQHGAVWPIWLAAAGAFLFAIWYGLAPLTDRLTSEVVIEDVRFEAFHALLTGYPLSWWLHGVGLGAFEAVFKQVKPGDLGGWWDYAHNDLLQWLFEMGLVGWIVLGLVITGLIRTLSLRMERIPLYAGLLALALIGLGDFSWHIPGTQVVLAAYLGVLLRPARRRVTRSSGPVRQPIGPSGPVRKTRRRRSRHRHRD